METGNGTSNLERFQNITPDQFEQEVEQIWQSASQIKDTVVEQVRQGSLPVLTGFGILSCITAQTFGYGLFHGQPAPADLTRVLYDRSVSMTGSGAR